jgi:hypothetical protein
MQGAQNLRREAYLQVRRNDEGEAQRHRWTFYETIIVALIISAAEAVRKWKFKMSHLQEETIHGPLQPVAVKGESADNP